MIALIGSEGSMGKRYQSIMRYLGVPFRALDALHSRETVLQAAQESDGVVIATPTATHAAFIRALAPLKKPILCEKPVVKNMGDMKELVELLKDTGTPFRMMFQYSMLARTDRIGPTLYNYFRHGSDGLIWDCMQVIGLARGAYMLREDSPVWSCKVNGLRVEFQHMDAAYIAYFQKWLRDPAQDLGEIVAIHEKTHAAAAVEATES